MALPILSVVTNAGNCFPIFESGFANREMISTLLAFRLRSSVRLMTAE